MTLSGCLEDNLARLTPLWGCALEGEEINSLRVRARGDLPAADAAQLLLDRGSASLDDLPDGIDGVTVEGMFGESVVLAVGRTSRLPANGELPVYFAPPDQLCEVPTSLTPRDRVALAVGSAGDVIAVGGQGAGDALLDEIVLMRDDHTEALVAQTPLVAPVVGHSISAVGPRTFLVMGGTNDEGGSRRTVQRLDVEPTGLGVRAAEAVTITLDDIPITPRAFHGAAVLPGGRVLIQGGCAQTERGTCVASEDSVLRSGFTMRADGAGVVAEVAPAMINPRYDHALHVSRDGVVFAVGGRNASAEGLRDIEMLLPDAPSWTPYGPALFEAVGEQEIVGSTLVEGGLIVFAVTDGTLWRVDQNHVEALEGWCSSPEDPCFLTPVDTFPIRRTLQVLGGERVLADRFVLPVGLLGRTGASAVDLATQKPGQSYRPPGPRAGAAVVSLADGTVLSVGGRVPASGSLAMPVVTRFRPMLDGPDEGTPDVSDPESGATVLHDRTEPPARISDAPLTQTLILEPDPERTTDFAATWVHYRGFRSRRFVLEADVEALNGAPELRFVFSRGAIARTEVAIGPDGVRLLVREADGAAVEVDCADEGLNFTGVGRSVRIVVSPSAIDVSSEGESVGRCPWAGAEAVAVGLGAVGAGTLRASGIRLSRG
ncbi:MAG: kelch repeat-containing protein [Myxococcota bacterium]